MMSIAASGSGVSTRLSIAKYPGVFMNPKLLSDEARSNVNLVAPPSDDRSTGVQVLTT